MLRKAVNGLLDGALTFFEWRERLLLDRPWGMALYVLTLPLAAAVAMPLIAAALVVVCFIEVFPPSDP